MQYYLFLGLAAALLCILVPLVVHVWREEGTPEWTASRAELRWLLLVSILYLILNSCEVLIRNERAIVFFASLCYVCSTSAPTWWFLFSLNYCGFHRFARRVRPWLWLFPVVAIAIVFTNPLHHWHWVSWRFIPVGSFIAMKATVYGPWFWVLFAWLQLLVISAAILVFISLFHRTRAFSRQSIIVLLACLTPACFNACYVLRLIPDQIKDFSPIGYALSALLFTFGVYYNRLFDLVPIARRALVDSLSDSLVAVDSDGRIIDANPAAVSLFKLPPDPVGGKAADNLFLGRCIAALDSSHDGIEEVSQDEKTWFEARITRVFAGKRVLKLYCLRDITEHRMLVESLTKALEEIQSLEGIVPICASCKKIRDDSGYWQQVEAYISSHTSVEFTHGLCPDCQQVLYNSVDELKHMKVGGEHDTPPE